MKNIILLAFVIFSSCSLITSTDRIFREEKDVEWVANRELEKNIEIKIVDDSIIPAITPVYGFATWIKIDADDKEEMKKKIINMLKERALVSDTPYGNSLSIQFRSFARIQEKPFMSAILNTLIFIATLTIYPGHSDIETSVEIKVLENGVIVYENKVVEISRQYSSTLGLFLLNKYRADLVQNRIIYEKTSMLLKDFAEFYLNEKSPSKKAKGK